MSTIAALVMASQTSLNLLKGVLLKGAGLDILWKSILGIAGLGGALASACGAFSDSLINYSRYCEKNFEF